MPKTLEPPLSDLAKFLLSVLGSKQISQLISLLSRGTVPVLDPEAVTPGQAVKQEKPARAAPQGLDELLGEMETAYSVEKFPPLTPDEARRLGDAFPGLSARISAYQGRNLVKMLRERMKGIVS